MEYYMCKNNKQLQKKLQVGDRVKIISSEKVNSIRKLGYDFMFGFNRSMFEYCGKEFVITHKKTRKEREYKDGTNPVSFFLKDAGGYTYCVEMFEVYPSMTMLKNE